MNRYKLPEGSGANPGKLKQKEKRKKGNIQMGLGITICSKMKKDILKRYLNTSIILFLKLF